MLKSAWTKLKRAHPSSSEWNRQLEWSWSWVNFSSRYSHHPKGIPIPSETEKPFLSQYSWSWLCCLSPLGLLFHFLISNNLLFLFLPCCLWGFIRLGFFPPPAINICPSFGWEHSLDMQELMCHWWTSPGFRTEWLTSVCVCMWSFNYLANMFHGRELVCLEQGKNLFGVLSLNSRFQKGERMRNAPQLLSSYPGYFPLQWWCPGLTQHAFNEMPCKLFKIDFN